MMVSKLSICKTHNTWNHIKAGEILLPLKTPKTLQMKEIPELSLKFQEAHMRNVYQTTETLKIKASFAEA